MASERERLSSIDLLPEEADEDVDWLYQELGRGRRLRTDILDAFNLRLQIKGIAPVSASALQRKAVRIAKLARRKRETQQIAAVMAEKFGDGGSNEQLTRMASDLIKTQVFETMETAGTMKANPATAEMLANFALALKSCQQTEKISVDTAVAIDKHLRKRVGEAVDAVARVKGISEEARLALRAELFGVSARLALPAATEGHSGGKPVQGSEV